MDRFSNTWSLMKSSLQVLKQEKMLLIFPLLSGLATVLIVLSFIAPLWVASLFTPLEAAFEQHTVLGFALVFLFYFINYFFVIYFNAGAVVAAIDVMKGRKPSVQKSLSIVNRRFKALLGWTLIAATIGLILNSIENQSDKIGKIVMGFLGLSWTVISFLVLPVLVLENKGPVASLKESTRMLRQSWGEQLIGHFSFGLVFFLLAVVIGVLFIPFTMFGPSVLIIGIVLAIIAVAMLGVLQWILQSIFMGAVYLYVREKNMPAQFSESQVGSAIK